MALSAGDKLGPYEILAPLGAGGMGEVWKARDTRLGRMVAIKVSSQKFTERFDREARAIAALNHPNICQIYDVGPDYIVMEYVEGHEIQGPMPLDLALKAAIQLASALETAHRKAIVHRDLKPANILSTKSGVKVLDFGLAKFDGTKGQHTGDSETRPITQEGTIVGTLQYMSPEQLQGKPADARSDIFSFGCVIYEVITGKRAFRAENQATLIASIIDREPDPIPYYQPMVQPALDRVIKKCLAKDPDERWQSASDLKSELQWILDSGSNASMPAQVAATHRRNTRLGWILAGIFAAALAAFAVFHYRTEPTPAAVVRFQIPLPEGTSWGAADTAVISPDGSTVAFTTTNRDRRRSLWIRRLDSLNSQPIAESTTSSLVSAGWSPDSRSLAYVLDSQLYRIGTVGASPQLVTSVPAWFDPAWGNGGIILFTGSESVHPLYQVPASGGEAKPIPGSAPNQISPTFLPDGRRFTYAGRPNGLYLGSLDSKGAKLLVAGSAGIFAPPSWLLYLRGSTLVAQSFDMGKDSLSGEPVAIAEQVATYVTPIQTDMVYFSASKGVLAYRSERSPTPSELTWYDRHGLRLGTVGEKGLYNNPALSPDGERLAIARVDPSTGTRDIWVLDLVRNVSSRLTFDKADELNPIWSPDGSRIAYSAARRGPNLRDIYWKKSDGSGEEELLLADSDNKAMEDWSRVGNLLLYNTGTGVKLIRLNGDRKPEVVLKAGFRQDHSSLSPDGRWLAYSSSETGRPEIFVQSFPLGNGKWQISSMGGNEPSWRRDGRELYFLNGSKLAAVDVEPSGSSFKTGIPKILFEVEVENINRRAHYVAAADGQRFLFVVTPQSLDTTPLVVVQNWQSALKQ